MKVLILALALACVAAVQSEDVGSRNNLITSIVIDIVNNHFSGLAQGDPKNLDGYEGAWYLPGAPNILGARGSVSNIRAAGYSNLQLTPSSGRIADTLSLEARFPFISGSVGAAEGEISIFSRRLSANGAAIGTATNVWVKLDAYVEIFDGNFGVRDIDIIFGVDNVNIELQLNLFGREVGPFVSTFLNNLPRYAETYKRQVGAVLNYIAGRLVERYL